MTFSSVPSRVDVQPQLCQALLYLVCSGSAVYVMFELIVLAAVLQDDDYKAAGATIVDKAASFKADVVLKVKPPSMQEADMLKERAR